MQTLCELNQAAFFKYFDLPSITVKFSLSLPEPYRLIGIDQLSLRVRQAPSQLDLERHRSSDKTKCREREGPGTNSPDD